ncbi:prepilin-type N-terminal cleavage/methylation domain-containing protein [Cognatilysobacter segetis]|uniref:prepilin-type N-terminal cleavage/methylation domain-containing protein n=1 Tax=Cognatilysobacter segetis TaxID=2492394 RepID=UPI001EE4D79F|nr:prepilin-type N-terminal cleavage/methylation domain-containing protein [Lysobacter segetis]
MSAACRPASASGFTLLELVVVLTIMGLAAALAAPSLLNGIESWRSRDTVDRLRDQVQGLPMRARTSGRSIALGADGTRLPFELDDEWAVSVPKPWSVQGNGYCEGGDVVLRRGAREWTIRAAAPFCDTEVAQ